MTNTGNFLDRRRRTVTGGRPGSGRVSHEKAVPVTSHRPVGQTGIAPPIPLPVRRGQVSRSARARGSSHGVAGRCSSSRPRIPVGTGCTRSSYSGGSARNGDQWAGIPAAHRRRRSRNRGMHHRARRCRPVHDLTLSGTRHLSRADVVSALRTGAVRGFTARVGRGPCSCGHRAPARRRCSVSGIILVLGLGGSAGMRCSERRR